MPLLYLRLLALPASAAQLPLTTRPGPRASLPLPSRPPRSFLGEKGFHTPLHGLASEHVSLARALLLQFDLVLDLDAGNDASDRLMDMGVGWPATLSHVRGTAAAWEGGLRGPGGAKGAEVRGRELKYAMVAQVKTS